jgi:hypothetical protein
MQASEASEVLSENDMLKDALQRQNASLLSDREQLIGQVSSLAAGKRCGTYPGCVHSITFVLTTLSQPNQARPIHSAASSKTRLAGAEVALVEIELKAVALTFVWAHSWRGWRTRRTRRWMCCGTTCTCLARRWRMRRKRPSLTWPRHYERESRCETLTLTVTLNAFCSNCGSSHRGRCAFSYPPLTPFQLVAQTHRSPTGRTLPPSRHLRSRRRPRGVFFSRTLSDCTSIHSPLPRCASQ